MGLDVKVINTQMVHKDEDADENSYENEIK